MIIKFENRYLDNFSHVFMDAKILNQGIGTKIILKEVFTVFAVVHETTFQIFLCNILAQELYDTSEECLSCSKAQ